MNLIHRGDSLSDTIKYWIKSDIENRIKEGSITAHFNAQVTSIKSNWLILNGPKGTFYPSNDFVIEMTSYCLDKSFPETLKITIRDDEFRTSFHLTETFETNRLGLYIAKTVCSGLRTSCWFIENGLFHAAQIMRHISTA